MKLHTIYETSDIREHVAKREFSAFEIFIFQDGSVLVVATDGGDDYDFNSIDEAMSWARDGGLDEAWHWLKHVA